MSLLKEYLVSLNLKVNNSQFQEFTGKIKEIDKLTAGITSSTAKNVTSASVAVVGFLATVTGGVAAFLDGLAQSDIETEKFAKRMWMTEEAARSLEFVLNAMGEDIDDLEDIAMNSELREHFFALRNEAKNLMPPSELQERYEKIRSIRFEFMRLRLLVSYGAQWVGYYLTTYLEGPIDRIKETLKKGNDFLHTNLQKIAKSVATVLYKIVFIVVALVESLSAAIRGIREFWESLNEGQKFSAKAGLGSLGIFTVLKALTKLTNPIFKIIAVINILLGLFADFAQYNKGGKSPLGWLYDDINKVFGDKELGVAFSETLKSILDMGSQLKDIFDETDKAFRDATGMGIVESFLLAVKDLLVAILNAITLILAPVNWLLNALGEGMKNWSEFFETGDLSALFMSDDKRNKNSYTQNIPVYDPSGRNSTSVNNQKVLNGGVNPTYNIFGSDPKATAKESDKYNRLLMNRAFGNI